MWQDIRFGLRTLGKNPGFTAVAVAALALGIGVNATVFSLANAILFKNLPFTDSERVLYLTSADSHHRRGNNAISYLDYRDLQALNKSFTGLGADTGCPGNFSDSTAFPENYRCSQITANRLLVAASR